MQRIATLDPSFVCIIRSKNGPASCLIISVIDNYQQAQYQYVCKI